MGRHSIPDPEDSDDDDHYVEPEYESDEHSDEPQYRDDYRDDSAVGGHRQAYTEAGYGYDDGYESPQTQDTHEDLGDTDELYTDHPSEFAGYRPGGYAADDGYSPNDGYTSDDGYASDDDYDDAEDGYDFGTHEPAPSEFASTPQTSGGHRNEGDWTGSHRTVAPGRRGVSVGVIAALVAVVAVVAGFILWRFFGDALSDRSDVAAGRCLQGEAKVAVLADPAIADQVGLFAKEFNETAGPVGDHCAAVSVQAADSDGVINGLVGQWPESFGDKPALWIPGSSVSAARLQAAVGTKSVSASKTLATSPVLLAVRPELKPALEQQNWATLPRLQSDPESLNNLNLEGWGSLRLALPKSGNSDASNLAAEAVAAASAPPDAPATAGVGAVSTMVAEAPKLANDSAEEAMDALLDGSDPADAQVHAVVTTEQQVIKRATGVSDAKTVLASWLPPAPVAVADFPTVLLAGDWLAEEQVAAASEFERFMRKPDQLAELAKAGFRVDGADPPTSDVTTAAVLGPTLSVGDDSARVAVANALSTPASAGAPAVSIMLDRSLNLTPVVAALNTQIDALAPNAAVGLTAFDGSSGTTLINLGQLSDDVDGQPRREALTSALNGLTPTGGAVSFTTLRNVYADALTNFRQGQTNSVLVITSGPHTDQSLDSAGLQQLIRSSADPARPVAVDVINVGNDSDRATWESVAQISGGTYQNVPASDSPEMVAAIKSMLA